jgi:hypothetical protein
LLKTHIYSVAVLWESVYSSAAVRCRLVYRVKAEFAEFGQSVNLLQLNSTLRNVAK